MRLATMSERCSIWSSRGGIISTPYHGYLKNLALAATGKMNAHFTALWDHGHIKFWSIPTLTQLLRERGFTNIRSRCVGRIPAIARSMIAVPQKAPCASPSCPNPLPSEKPNNAYP